jgi:hypothetical protein
MAFTARTDHKESLQTLAMSMRQEKGSDLTNLELAKAMKDLNNIPSNIKNSCVIDYNKMKSDFNSWVTEGAQDWIDSSVWIANASYPKYCSSGGYKFYRQDFVPGFKGTFVKIRNKIRENAKSSVLKKMYAVVGMGEDKWNPADIIAIKASGSNRTMSLLENFDATKVSKESKETRKQNKDLSKDPMINVMQDLDEMYEYNKLIDDLFKKKELIGISLKKATSPSVKMEVLDHKEVKGLKKALDLKIEITKVHYSTTNQKCIVDFTIGDQKGNYLDIRGFESSRKIADIQIQLSKKGSSAAHGKVTLPVVTLIAKLSKGRAALSKLNSKKRSMFKNLKKSSIHGFTDWTNFDDYRNNPVQLEIDKDKWSEYIQWLSKNRHESVAVNKEVDKLMKKKTGVFDAAKYLKHKVQAYEVGFLLDTQQKQIKDDIKENIIKSMISYAGSKGMLIFNDSKATAFMVSSTYLKCGG